MSFRVDLWNGFNIIKNQFSSTINKISNLYDVLLSYAGYEKIYSKNLESLYKDNKDLFEEKYLIDKNIIKLINNFKSESEYHREHYKYIKHNLIVSLKENAEKEKTVLNNLFEEGIQNQENFNKMKNTLIEKQKNYNNSLKDFYDYISTIKEDDLNSMFENEKMQSFCINPSSSRKSIFKMPTMNMSDINLNYSFNGDIKTNKNHINKKEKLIEKIRKNKDEYTTLLNKSNEYLETYKKKAEGVLQFLEEKYQSFILNIHSTLLTTVDHKTDLINKLNLLYRTYLENDLKNFTIKDEIEEFVIKNVTKEFPIYKFEFIQNNYDKDNFTSIDINNYLKERLDNENDTGLLIKSRTFKRYEIKKPIKKKNTNAKEIKASMLLEHPINDEVNEYKIKSNIFLLEDYVEELINEKNDDKKEEKKDEKEDENDNININKISYSDSSSKMMEVSIIKPLLDKNNDNHLKYLDNLFKCLNVKRSKGHFLLNEKSYNNILDIFIFLLSNFPDKDNILKNIIILAQTFYKIDNDNTEKNKSKIFVQNGLKNNSIFCNTETWHRVINCNLSSIVYNRDLSLQFDKIEINKKINVLVYNILMSYLSDIKYFTDDENVFNEIKNFYVRIYNLDADKLNKEINGIINYSPPPKKKKGITFSFDKKK